MHSRVDQINLNEKMQQWKLNEPNDSFFFRPYVEQNELSGNMTNDNIFGDDEDDDPDDDLIEVRLNGDAGSGLLLVMQTAWQQQLLAKYGQMCLLDATYKTTRYSLPLFFMCVKTNVDYVVVASFVTQFENTDSIAEALDIVKKWNPSWKPSAFMVDCSEAEMQSIERIFTGN